MDIQMIQAHMMTAAAAGWISLASLVSPVAMRHMTITIENPKRKREIKIRIQSRAELVP
jgi:hypothetical protein